jgi:pyruvate,orthophosphate dikinase
VPKLVYDFAEGHKDLKDLLGGKGANLAEMTRLGLPVPPGFTITTEACRAFLELGHEPPGLADEMAKHLRALEAAMGRRLGDPADPLLVSVRSGAKFSMPGMMETVLNIGLTDASVKGLAEQSGNLRFAWDSYRRLLQMFGRTVLGIDGELFEHALDQAKTSKGTKLDLDLDAGDLATLVDRFKAIILETTGAPFPQDPVEQLRLATFAVFKSWNGARAVLYRRQERIPADLGTAVNVCSMVFGNLGNDSGTGVAFTRDPSTGQVGVYGDYLQNAQGEDVVAGIRNTLPLQDLEQIDPTSYAQLTQIMATLESHYRDLCDIEFTIERGTLWMLQTRIGKRTAEAAFRIAIQLVDEGVIDLDEALARVNGAQLANLMFPKFDATVERELVAQGMAASPGAATGRVVFDSPTAVEWVARGENVILVRRETNPDDLDGMIAAEGVLTSRGGKTSHAAVVARGMGKTCVCGAEDLDVDTKIRRIVCPDGSVITEGDVVSIDGSTGEVFRGSVPVVPSPVVEYFEGRLFPTDADDLVNAVDRLMAHGDARRQLGRYRFVPHRAHVPGRAPQARRAADPGDDHDSAHRSARYPHAASARRLRRHPRSDGRTARHHPPHRPPVARVPSRPHGVVGEGGAGRGRWRDRRGRRPAARCRAPPPRGQSDAGSARRAAGSGDARSFRHAGQGDRAGGGRAHQGRWRSEA